MDPISLDAVGAPQRPRLQATPAARVALEAVRAREGGQLMFVQSGGCCAGSTPMCFSDGEFLTGPGDVLLGDIDGAPFYIDASLDTAWGHPGIVLDVRPGRPEGFSLGTVDGGHFVSLTDACLIEGARGADDVG
jgi:uncharacterized protein (DUF779 family)